MLQPYPFERRVGASLRSAFWSGLFVTFFLFFLKPFGTQVSQGAEGRFLMICAYFGLVTMVVSLAINALCMLFPSIFDEERWRVWKEVLFNLFFIGCIGLGNLLLASFLWEVPLNGQTFWYWQGLTFAIGIFPTFFGAFFGQMKLSKKYAAEAAGLHLQNRHALTAAPPNALSAQPIIFTGENQNETLRLEASQIAYLAAQDNYVQIFYFENEVLKSRMLRATLRKKEDELAGQPQFFRCHRTYVVNFDKVVRVSGNAQGYRLHLMGVEETIPVSRNLNEVVRKRLGER